MNIHHRNLENLVTENNLSPELNNDVFKFIKKPYSLQATSHFRSRKIRTAKYGIETLSHLGSKLWNLVPNEYKTKESLADFKAKQKLGSRRTVLAGYAKYIFTKWVLFKFPAR